MRYRTCHNCVFANDTCERRDAIRAGVAGLSITSVAFRCDRRSALYQPGDRVSVTWVVPNEDGGWDYDANEETWPASVIKESGSRFVIRVDDVDSDEGTPARSFVKNDSLYAKVSALKLERRDEPPVRPCKLCGQIAELGLEGCWQIGSVPDRDCLRAALTDAEKERRG